ncbi:MFS transporter [Nocardioides rubriscoriae]|uniref:MFS transporter n=1 Tax=Nocardioides rubriscoriae TaxID=642762 RepID=UPI001FEB8663|nr:MFS transporter [Nocardioides rubriscoriae]
MTTAGARVEVDRRSRTLLVFCAAAVMFAAIDTYVVVLALPDMMASVDISVDQLQRAAPIVSGFLLGYVAVLPLIGRVADLRGPVPVLAASLIAFAVGSAVTAVAYDLPSIVLGRFLQGVGGGGLVPATMALVAATYPVEHRGLPLGLVSAVQEFGAVLGPLFGAAVLAFTSWRGIFALNCAAAVALWAVVRVLRRADDQTGTDDGAPGRRGRRDVPGALALVVAVAAALMAISPPQRLYTDLTYGELFVPVVPGGGRWVQPMGLIAVVAFLVFCARCLLARRPLVDVRSWGRSLAEADLAGAALLAVVLGGIVLAFATADPEVSVLSAQGPWFLLGSALALVALVLHLRRTEDPLVPRGTLSARPAWGSLVVSLLVGWALIAALVDIPLFARTAEKGYTQLDAALVLLRFLVALPVGAVVGGVLVRHLPAGLITAAGMLAASGSFWWMSHWDQSTLDSAATPTVALVLGGLGFGLALAPVNAAMLASTRGDTHGLASALVVVARMVGMLVGISVLTTYGLAQLYAARRDDPDLGVRALGILQEQAVFEGATVVALAAAALALVVLRGAPTRGVGSGQVLGASG